MKNTKKLFFRKIILMVMLPLLPWACVEPIDIESGNYENALVVEGTITNELTSQEILLSRTFRLEENGPAKETNARVKVVGDNSVYEFREAEPGRYVSEIPFQAQKGIAYNLEIVTANGREYNSQSVELPQSSTISNLYAAQTNFEGETGVGIFVDVSGTGETSGLFRFEYAETYKIISPFKYGLDARVIDGEIVEFEKTRQETICYPTENSREIFLANTNIQTGNDLDAFLLRFLERSNFRTAYRYSILVKQFSISEESFSFYNTLKDFSESESLFSENQLGLIPGNIFSVNDPDEPVIGMFSVAGVNSRRIFFSFEDFYESDFGVDDHVECEVLLPPTSSRAELEAVGGQLANGSIKYFGFELGTGYRFAKAGCIDCTLFGPNSAPDFWEE